MDMYMTYNATVAKALQQYIINFAVNGVPNGQSSLHNFQSTAMLIVEYD